MDIFNVLSLLGGLSMFLFGMELMGQALERRAGSGLRTLLGKLTNNKWAGLLTGLGVTAIIQSSSATTVMVVGFVNSGIMTLKQSINVIMGANIGTTVTAWILSLAGIDSANVWVKLLKPSSFTPVLALIGIIMYMFSKKDKTKDTGVILLGFAVLMFGMEEMSGSVSGLKNVPGFQQMFLMFTNPILGVLVGAVLTAIIQSSSASVGILQALASTGQVTYGAAIPIIMGQNIGTCVTALISSVGANKNAKRAAMVHLSFNIIGTIVWLTVFCIVKLIFAPVLLTEPASLLGIAVAHSVFNILCVALMLPMGGLLEKLVCKIVPDREEKDDALTELDERLLVSPTLALEQCSALIGDMENCASEALKDAVESLDQYTDELGEQVKANEDKTDHYEDIIGTYLVKLSSRKISEEESASASEYLKVIGDVERIADHALNILQAAEEMNDSELSFTPDAKKELKVMTDAVQEILYLTLDGFVNNDPAVAGKVEPLEEVIDHLKTELRTRHIKRLQAGNCSIEAGFVWSDLLTDLERISDHCSNIAATVLDASHQELHLHETIREVTVGNENFEEAYHDYSRKYQLS